MLRLQSVVVIGFVLVAPLPAQGMSAKQHEPPGRLIDVGGRKLHLHCTGTGSPTIVLMAGGSAFSID